MRVVAITGWGRGQRGTIVEGITMAAIAVGPKVFGLLQLLSTLHGKLRWILVAIYF